jgi:hypothetical protein
MSAASAVGDVRVGEVGPGFVGEMPARKDVDRMRDCSDTLGCRAWEAVGSFGLASSSGVTISGPAADAASSSFAFAPGLGLEVD